MRAVVLLAVCLLGACATAPVATDIAKSVSAENVIDQRWIAKETVNVTVKRDKGIFGAVCVIRLYVDGAETADLWPSQKIDLLLPIGMHLLGAKTADAFCGGTLVEIAVTISDGIKSVYRVGVGSSGDFQLQPTAF